MIYTDGEPTICSKGTDIGRLKAGELINRKELLDFITEKQIHYNNLRNNSISESTRNYCFGKRMILNDVSEKFLGVTFFGHEDGIEITNFPSFKVIKSKLV